MVATSAGILLYSGLVELMAHEFLFSHSLRDAKTSTVFLAFGWMVLGAGKPSPPRPLYHAPPAD